MNYLRLTVLLAAMLAVWVTPAWARQENTGAPRVEAAGATSSAMIDIHFFGRDDCGFCRKEKRYFESSPVYRTGDIRVIYYDIIDDPEAKRLFDDIVEANGLAKITPLTLVGGEVIQGFEAPETTGSLIERALETERKQGPFPLSYYMHKRGEAQVASGCSADGREVCTVSSEVYRFKLPLLGVVDLRDVSLSALSLILGLVDGFNPCAMWVLVTFLLILMQIGDRRKMFLVAGLFILAEAIMYYLILVAWYKTWDFVGLDAIVTPLVGILALGSGIFFLYRYRASTNTLTCDVTDIEQQTKIERTISSLVHSPITIATVAAIIGLAFSVNVIEFACSIGIPQAFTKILDLNLLDAWTRQWYLFLYILAYMADDFVVFALALWGIDRLHGSAKYSRASLLVGGVLMVLLGILMLIAPDALVLSV